MGISALTRKRRHDAKIAATRLRLRAFAEGMVEFVWLALTERTVIEGRRWPAISARQAETIEPVIFKDDTMTGGASIIVDVSMLRT